MTTSPFNWQGLRPDHATQGRAMPRIRRMAASMLPGELVERRDAQGRVVALRATVESGFLRAGRFFTHAQAAAAVAAAVGRGVRRMKI